MDAVRWNVVVGSVVGEDAVVGCGEVECGGGSVVGEVGSGG